MRNIILTADRPTGKLHIGHFVGSLKERVRLQNETLKEIKNVIGINYYDNDSFEKEQIAKYSK